MVNHPESGTESRQNIVTAKDNLSVSERVHVYVDTCVVSQIKDLIVGPKNAGQAKKHKEYAEALDSLTQRDDIAWLHSTAVWEELQKTPGLYHRVALNFIYRMGRQVHGCRWANRRHRG